jgi:hypothetical protein
VAEVMAGQSQCVSLGRVIGCLYLCRGIRHEAARVHNGTRRRCGVAAGGSSAQSKKIYRIGYLTANLSSYPWVNGFVRELSDRGYSEGNNLTIEWREAKGHSELLPGMAADLVRQNVDVIVERLKFVHRRNLRSRLLQSCAKGRIR